MFYKGNLRCPVQSYKEYSRHRPVQMTDPESPFYQRLCRNIKDDVWYINQAMGKNTLSKFVKTMCDKAGVEGRKTNHSARKTTVPSLVHAGVSPTQVMQLSGHKKSNL